MTDTTSPAVESRYFYDGDGKLETAVDAKNNAWSTQYDGFGRPMRQVDPLGNYTLTSYDSGSRPARIRACSVDGVLMAQTELAYNDRGLMTSQTTATEIAEGAVLSSVTERFEYDGRNLLERAIDGSGFGYELIRDTAGRVESNRSYAEDAIGSYRVDYVLDDRGNVLTESHHAAAGHGVEGSPSCPVRKVSAARQLGEGRLEAVTWRK